MKKLTLVAALLTFLLFSCKKEPKVHLFSVQHLYSSVHPNLTYQIFFPNQNNFMFYSDQNFEVPFSANPGDPMIFFIDADLSFTDTFVVGYNYPNYKLDTILINSKITTYKLK